MRCPTAPMRTSHDTVAKAWVSGHRLGLRPSRLQQVLASDARNSQAGLRQGIPWVSSARSQGGSRCEWVRAGAAHGWDMGWDARWWTGRHAGSGNPGGTLAAQARVWGRLGWPVGGVVEPPVFPGVLAVPCRPRYFLRRNVPSSSMQTHSRHCHRLRHPSSSEPSMGPDASVASRYATWRAGLGGKRGWGSLFSGAERRCVVFSHSTGQSSPTSFPLTQRPRANVPIVSCV